MIIWVDGWQMQCCGEPFSVGSEVSWTLRPADRDRLTTVLGADLAATVDACEEHHGGVPEGTPPVTGKVKAIKTVYYPPGGESQTLAGYLVNLRSRD